MTGLLEEQLCSLLSECSHSSLVRSTYHLCILCDRWFDFSKICQISFGRLQQEYERVANKLTCCSVSQHVQKFPQNMGWNVPRNQGNDGNIISKNPMTTQPSKISFPPASTSSSSEKKSSTRWVVGPRCSEKFDQEDRKIHVKIQKAP